MYLCREIFDILKAISQEYTSNELQINIIDIEEEENLKLSYWGYFVPAIYIIDNTTESAYLYPTRHFVLDAQGFRESLRNSSYVNDTKLFFRVAPVIHSEP
jgi:hypothetical protein